MEETRPVRQTSIAGCIDCGAVVHKGVVTEGARLLCPRCRSVLENPKKNTINRTLALSLSGLMLFIPACFLPVLELNILGLSGNCTMIKGVMQMFGNGFWWMSFLVLFCSVIVPMAIFGLLIFITLSVKFNYSSAMLKTGLKLYRILHEWTMLDVYMLGILIAYIKMRDFGEISVSAGLYCFSASLVLAVFSTLAFEPRVVWNWIGSKQDGKYGIGELTSGSVLCTMCGMLCNRHTEDGRLLRKCGRCNATLHERKPSSILRSWALILTGFFLLIPANLCPITYIVYYGFGEPDTILTGIGCLIRDGMIPIAILVFIASIIVPIVKLIVLSFLLSAIHFKWRMNTYQCTVMYRFISVIGRWSMLDLFMLSILVAMVEMGAVSSIVPGVGATAFASVVVITMLAAMHFDPRLLWDLEESDNG